MTTRRKNQEIEAAIAEGLDDVRHGRVTPAFQSAEEFQRYRRTPEYQAMIAKDELEDALEFQDPKVNRDIRISAQEYREGKHRPAEELLAELRRLDAEESN